MANNSAANKVKKKASIDITQAKLDSVFRAAPIGIGLVSDRVILEANDRLCAMLGYSREELVGKNARMLYPSDKEYEFVGREKIKDITLEMIGLPDEFVEHGKRGELLNKYNLSSEGIANLIRSELL